jgi:hypothetical protein
MASLTPVDFDPFAVTDGGGGVTRAQVPAGVTQVTVTPQNGLRLTPVDHDPFNDDKYKAAAVAERDALKAQGIDTGAGYTRRLAQGATMGLADEIIAGLTTPLEMVRQGTFDPREGYNYAKARENLLLEDSRNQTGLPGAAVEALGGVATGGLLAKGGVLPTANLAPGASLGAKIGVGMAEGAGIGGLYGAAEGEGLQGRLQEGAKGAGIGLAAGAAFPLVAQGAGSAYHAIQNARAGQQVARETGISPDVMRMLGSTLEADGTLSSRGLANMAAAGNEAMLADAGPNARAILDTAIQRGGPGAVAAREAIEARVGRSAKDIVDSLDQNLGAPQGVMATRDAIREGSAAARDAAYQAAYSRPIDYSSQAGRTLENLIQNRVPPSAIRAANDLMRVEGHASRQILAHLADDGTVVFQKMPDVRQIDYLTRGLNEVADAANGQGALGGTTNLGRAYQGLSRKIRDTLRQHVPEYDNALNVAADAISRSKAVEIGSKLFSPSVTRDAAAGMIKGMTAAEKTALATGIRANIDDAMARVTRTVMDGDTDAREAIKALKDFSSRANKEKLSIAIGPLRAGKIFSDLDKATKSFELRAAVAENSKTYARLATDRRIKEITQPGPAGQFLQGKPLNAGRRVAQVLTGKTPERIAAKEDAIYSQIAKLLTGSKDDAFPLFQGIDKLKSLDLQNEADANSIARVLTRSQPAAVYPLTSLLEGTTRRR